MTMPHLLPAPFPAPLAASLYVALGGALGSVLRYQAGRAMAHWIGIGPATAFPWATLGVNVIGSLAMGLLVGWLARHGESGGLAGSDNLRLMLGVGLLGGFTTFSAFSMELVLLAERGALGLAAAYAGFSVIAGVTATVLGLLIMRASA